MDAIEVFNRVRGLPYHCPESANDLNYTCWGKHRILFDELKKNGYKVRFRVCSFKWSKEKLPKEVYELAPQDEDKHLFLEICLNKKWVVLDCSNDPELPGFNAWDGISDCRLEVKPIKIFSPEESAKIERDMQDNFESVTKKYNKVYKALNIFLDKMRRTKRGKKASKK